MTRKHILLPCIALALLTSIGIASCGSDDTAEAALTKAQFQSRANIICSTASNEQFEIAGTYLKQHPKLEEADLIEPAVIPPLERELEELLALPAPSSFQAQAEIYTEEFRKALEALQDEPLSALSPEENPFRKANSLAERYKLGDCSDTP